jgi:hypothetical protein
MGELVSVISPGTGIFKVDSLLPRVTKQRMIEHGIGCDMIFMAKPPLHSVPLFRYIDKPKTEPMMVFGLTMQVYSDKESRRFATAGVFDIPHWIHISFFDSKLEQGNSAGSNEGTASLLSKREFVPSCAMPGVQPNYAGGSLLSVDNC